MRVRSRSSQRHPADPAFGDRVHAGSPDVTKGGPDPGIGENRVERGREVRSAVADHELSSVGLAVEVHDQGTHWAPRRWRIHVSMPGCPARIAPRRRRTNTIAATSPSVSRLSGMNLCAASSALGTVQGRPSRSSLRLSVSAPRPRPDHAQAGSPLQPRTAAGCASRCARRPIITQTSRARFRTWKLSWVPVPPGEACLSAIARRIPAAARSCRSGVDTYRPRTRLGGPGPVSQGYLRGFA